MWSGEGRPAYAAGIVACVCNGLPCGLRGSEPAPSAALLFSRACRHLHQQLGDARLGRGRVWGAVRRALSPRPAQAGACRTSVGALEGRPLQQRERHPLARSLCLEAGVWCIWRAITCSSWTRHLGFCSSLRASTSEILGEVHEVCRGGVLVFTSLAGVDGHREIKTTQWYANYTPRARGCRGFMRERSARDTLAGTPLRMRLVTRRDAPGRTRTRTENTSRSALESPDDQDWGETVIAPLGHLFSLGYDAAPVTLAIGDQPVDITLKAIGGYSALAGFVALLTGGTGFDGKFGNVLWILFGMYIAALPALLILGGIAALAERNGIEIPDMTDNQAAFVFGVAVFGLGLIVRYAVLDPDTRHPTHAAAVAGAVLLAVPFVIIAFRALGTARPDDPPGE
jgi:hypothetical protein